MALNSLFFDKEKNINEILLVYDGHTYKNYSTKGMITMDFKKIGFIGLGLIGGSIAKAVRRYYPDYEIIAFDNNKETLALATKESVIHVACTSIDDNFKRCDYIFLCAPAGFNTAYLKELLPYLHRELILTDVGSVKTPIHEEVTRLGLEEYFIGGHPMAGSEKSGFANSRPMLIENAYFILTPSAGIPQAKIDAYTAFAESLHSIPLVLDYQIHDQATGTISHLPQIIAASLVNFVRDTDTADELMKHLAAGGFKDITRIASSSPTMWQHICAQNKDNISRILGDYIHALTQAKALIDQGQTERIYDMFDHAGSYRDSMPDSSAGLIKKSFCIYCDIPDESGAIATIATILASNAINIKNVGIVHNREFEEGVLRIEFYDETSCGRAVTLLKRHRYVIYER